MKNLLLLLIFASIGCTSPKTLPNLGDRFVFPQDWKILAISTGQTAPYNPILINKVKYDVAVDNGNTVIYIGTNDPKFSSPEGLSIGSTLEQVLATGAQYPKEESGWGFHTKLPSGWSVGFSVGHHMTEDALQPDSKVLWFFKRK